MVKPTVHHLNHRQVPIIAADQSLYAFPEQFQWSWPETHGEVAECSSGASKHYALIQC